MTADDIERAICDRLRTTFPTGIVVEPWPENAVEYKVNAAHGAVLVRWIRSTYSDPDGSRMQRQRNTVTVFCAARSLAAASVGYQGAREMMAAARDALFGYRPDGRHIRFFPIDDGFVMQKGEIYWYQVTLAGTTPYPIQ